MNEGQECKEMLDELDRLSGRVAYLDEMYQFYYKNVKEKISSEIADIWEDINDLRMRIQELHKKRPVGT